MPACAATRVNSPKVQRTRSTRWTPMSPIAPWPAWARSIRHVAAAGWSRWQRATTRQPLAWNAGMWARPKPSPMMPTVGACWVMGSVLVGVGEDRHSRRQTAGSIRVESAVLRARLDRLLQPARMVAHEPAERRTNEDLALEPAGQSTLDADRALVAKEGTAVEVLKHEPVLQQVDRALDALEPDLLGFEERHPFNGAIHLLSALLPVPERGDHGMELYELTVALGLQYHR